MNDYQKLDLLRDICKVRRFSQEKVAKILGVSRRSFSAWLNGNGKPSEERWRQGFINLLLHHLKLNSAPQLFHKIWNEVMIGVWEWLPLSEQETVALDLEAPADLFLNVPSRLLHLKTLVGRDELIGDLKQRVVSGQNVALTGMPGVGKTALALELSRNAEILERFKDGIVWIKMGQQPSFIGELMKLAEVLKLDTGEIKTEEKLIKGIQNKIGRGHFLFFIDDVWPTGVEHVKRLLSFSGPNCCNILTTRDQTIARSFTVPSQIITIPELEYEAPDSPAIHLLRLLAPKIWTADQSGVKHLIRKVGGLPLALVLLGGYLGHPERNLRAEDSKQALVEIDDAMTRLNLVIQRLGSLEDKEVTLQEIIALSIDALPKYMVTYFYAIGAFASKPARFDWSACQAVTGADDYTIRTLILRNLLEIDAQEELAIHQVLSDFTRTKVNINDVERHRSYYLSQVNKNRRDWRYIEKLYEQLRWAWRFMPEGTEMINFIKALSVYQSYRGFYDEALEWTNQSILVGQKEQWGQELAWLLSHRGHLFLEHARLEESIKDFEESAKIYTNLKELENVIQAFVDIGVAYKNMGDFVKAKFYLGSATKAGDNSTSPLVSNSILLFTADINRREGQWQAADEIYKICLSYARSLKDKFQEAQILNNLGLLSRNQG
ncbi:MAG: hypothetical protein H0X31_23940, partial [Nostocaceae cyanobacterium]|nr:hypothetical protein [Nostocaceae cyanobacterium]